MSAISALDYSILALLLGAALTSVFVGLKRRAALIAAGKGGAASAGRERLNLRAFAARGLLTSRLKKRPVAGLAHSLMFGGALVAIFGHAAFVLSFFGVPVYQGSFGFLVMELGRELAGILMFTGVAFFLVRRLTRLERLTAGGERKGFVVMELLFLASIVAGFTAEAFRLADPASASRGEFLGLTLAAGLQGLDGGLLGAGGHLVWWLHGLLSVAFIGLIAHTPLSHMLLAPANAALARPRSGITLAPIDFDAEPEGDAEMSFGAAKLADLDGKKLLDFSACLWCGRCQEVCPAAQTGKALSPKKVMTTCATWLEDKRFDDPGLIDAIGLDAVFDCTTCAACVEECPASNSPAETILEFRRHFVMDRSAMPDTLALANRNLESRGHPFVGTAANPDDWRKGLDVPLFESGKTEYLLWIGCSVAYEARAQEVARAMLRILDAAGVSYGILEESRCTGDPAKMAGDEMQFVEIAQANIEDFRERKIQKVITMCAHCFNSFDRYYPELGADWQTIPHSVLIDRLIAVVGGGGHGLATAYYLAKEHGITNVAVVEKGWLGGGNTARNTTIVRSNYLWDEAAWLYEHAMKLWEGLSQDLNYNVMYSQRGVMNLGHTLQDMRDIHRRVNANRLNGIDGEVLDVKQIQEIVPIMDCSKHTRYPIMGASWQPRGGVARHDAVAWGFARGADALGVDMLQQTEVTGIRKSGNKVLGVETNRGFIAADTVGVVTAGNSGVLAKMAGFQLPIESHPLQALVSEPMKPILDTVVMSNKVHGYVSQSDKGDLVIGAGIDGYNGYGQRGSYSTIEHTLQAIVELFPMFSRVRMNRQWGGIVDTCPDACPIISATPVGGLFFNCGWGTGGFKATPGSGNVFAATLAAGKPHPLAAPFSIDRFISGKLIDEHGAAGVAH